MSALKTPPRRTRLGLEALDERALPSGYRQTNLVSDVPGQARLTDASLIDAQGISLSPTGGAFWVSAHGTGTSPLYTGDVNGSAVGRPFAVAVAGGAPTGQVFNGTPDFVVRSGAAAAAPPFIFAADTGFITGWNPNVPAAGSRVSLPGVSRPGAAAYTGLALANNGAANFLYAADHRNGRIDVFDAAYAPATLAGNFTDPNLPAGDVPYNIQAIDGKLYVTYTSSAPGSPGVLPGPAPGFGSVVNEFDLNGNLLRRIATNAGLFAPWGLAKAPADFGTFANDLLVGDHGTGLIAAYDLTTGQSRGFLTDEQGVPVRIDGLYGLAFGNGATAGDRNALYFAAGPRGGQDGLFGSLRFVASSGPPGGLFPTASGGAPGAAVAIDGLAGAHAGPRLADVGTPPHKKALMHRPAVRAAHATRLALTKTIDLHRPPATFNLSLGESADG